MFRVGAYSPPSVAKELLSYQLGFVLWFRGMYAENHAAVEFGGRCARYHVKESWLLHCERNAAGDCRFEYRVHVLY